MSSCRVFCIGWNQPLADPVPSDINVSWALVCYICHWCCKFFSPCLKHLSVFLCWFCKLCQRHTAFLCRIISVRLRQHLWYCFCLLQNWVAFLMHFYLSVLEIVCIWVKLVSILLWSEFGHLNCEIEENHNCMYSTAVDWKLLTNSGYPVIVYLIYAMLEFENAISDGDVLKFLFCKVINSVVHYL